MTSRRLAASILVLGEASRGRDVAEQRIGCSDLHERDGGARNVHRGTNTTIGGHIIPSFNVKIDTSISKAAVSFIGTKVTLTGPVDGTITADNTVPYGKIEKSTLKFVGTIGGKSVTLTGDVTGAIDGSHS